MTNPTTKENRLYFIDAIRAFAILMMLQGHFVSSLLADEFRNDSIFYKSWEYLRGMTAPLFFTVSGFIFTYLLVSKYDLGLKNPRVQKGVKRGIQLIIIGHLLQLRIPDLLRGTINESFYFAHVLQCIGISIIGIVLVYLVCYKVKRILFPMMLFLITITLFLFHHEYINWDYSFMPKMVSNYFTRENGSIFTIFPWFGYATFGGFLSVLFRDFKSTPNFRNFAIAATFIFGILLGFFPANILSGVDSFFEIFSIKGVLHNVYLFERLGNSLLVFSLFLLFEKYFKHKIVQTIGQKTLALYIIHSILLYGSFSGYGLRHFYYHALSPTQTIIGAIVFMVGICLLVFIPIKLRILKSL